MVLTRSAEKRLANAGKVEELAVRPKLNDTPSTPTPSILGVKKQGANTVNAFSRTSTGLQTPDVSHVAVGDDDSPYETAKESPESYRDAESLLVDASGASTPPARLTTLQPNSCPQLASSSPAPVKSSVVDESPVPTARLRSHPTEPKDESLLSVIHNDLHDTQTESAPGHLGEDTIDDQSNGAKRVGGLTIAPETENDSDDQAPEILTTKRATKPRKSATLKTKGRRESMLGQQDRLPDDNRSHPTDTKAFDNKRRSFVSETAPTKVPDPTPQSQDSNLPINEHDTEERSSIGNLINEHHPAMLVSYHPSASPQTTMISSRRTGTLRTNTQSSMSRVLPTHQQNPNFCAPNSTKSLTSYRENLFLNRVAPTSRKRSGGFRLTNEWSTKKRKFIVT